MNHALILPRQDLSVPARLDWMLRILAVLVAGHFTLAYIHGTKDFLDIPRYAAGAERLPFQYRALTGWILRILLHLPGIATLKPDGPGSMQSPHMISWAGLVFLSTLWIQRSARNAAAIFVRGTIAPRLAALGYMPVLYVIYEAMANGYRPSFPYDIPSLALFFAALTALMRDRRAALLILFALDSLSRETSLFLVPIFLCWTWPDTARRPASLACAAAMALLWLAARFLVAILYAHNAVNPDTQHLSGLAHGMEFQLFNNVRMLADPLHLANIASALCWLWLPVCLFWRHIDDSRLRAAILLCTPPIVAAMLVVGRIAEVRVFAELTPLYWLATLVIARNLASTARPLRSASVPPC